MIFFTRKRGNFHILIHIHGFENTHPLHLFFHITFYSFSNIIKYISHVVMYYGFFYDVASIKLRRTYGYAIWLMDNENTCWIQTKRERERVITEENHSLDDVSYELCKG